MVIASLKPLKNCDSYCLLENGAAMFLTKLFLACQTVLYWPSIFHRFTGVGLAENTGFTG